MKYLKKCLFYIVLMSFNSTYIFTEKNKNLYKKKYTLLVYMAADNNLARYALNNIEQMLKVGSNEQINIVVQINTPGNKNVTQRYFIEKGKKRLIQAYGQAPQQKLNSGNAQTLIDSVAWAMKYYPADNLILNIWNHGSGMHDRKLHQFFYDSDHVLIDDKIEAQDDFFSIKPRGICFDDTYKSYITNQALQLALHEIHNKILQGKKIAVVWLEACLMSMIEITHILKDHADYLVASENVEYAPGSNYELVLSFFDKKNLMPKNFANHIVNSFHQVYGPTKIPFTQSAIDLSKVKAIENNIDLVAKQILLAMHDQKNESVIKMLQKSKKHPACTCFYEPTYIDLQHFYKNLQLNLHDISLANMTKERMIKTDLNKLLNEGINFINNAVIANTTGLNFKNAGGISIYFPEHRILSSYLKSSFALSNSWITMLTEYMSHGN